VGRDRELHFDIGVYFDISGVSVVLRCRSNREDSRGEQIRKADAAVHLGTHAISNAIHNLGAVLRGVDMYPEGTLPEGRIDDLHDGPGNVGYIGVGRRSCRKAFQDVLAEVSIGSIVIFRLTCLVRGRACVGEMIGP
jgi:hypothetical protein